MIDLQQFCDNSIRPRPQLASPFSQNGKTWATDGHILVGVPLINDVEEREGAPRVSTIMAEAWKVDGEPFLIPETEFVKCKFCDGKGRDVKCPECKGKGYLSFSTNYHEYYPDCESCAGDGDLDECPHCSGTGFSTIDLVKIGPAKFTSASLKKLSSLPNLKLFIDSPKKVARILFDGGEGAVMPALDW